MQYVMDNDITGGNTSPAPMFTTSLLYAAQQDQQRQGHNASARPKPRRRRRRHIPHSERLPEAVDRRNARERRRVDEVNSAFLKLQGHLPEGDVLQGITSCFGSANKKLSKIKILYDAIDYIASLSRILSPEAQSNHGNVGAVGYDQTVTGMSTSTSSWLPEEEYFRIEQEPSYQGFYPGDMSRGFEGDFRDALLQDPSKRNVATAQHGDRCDQLTNYQNFTLGMYQNQSQCNEQYPYCHTQGTSPILDHRELHSAMKQESFMKPCYRETLY